MNVFNTLFYDTLCDIQSAWCLGNVAGDGPKLRDIVLR
jgi:hypothetical protein